MFDEGGAAPVASDAEHFLELVGRHDDGVGD